MHSLAFLEGGLQPFQRPQLEGIPERFWLMASQGNQGTAHALVVGCRSPRFGPIFQSCRAFRVETLYPGDPGLLRQKPACKPAWVAYKPGLSRMATITFARCTRLWGSFPDAASRRTSVSSSVVNDRSFTAFRIRFSWLSQENYIRFIWREDHKAGL